MNKDIIQGKWNELKGKIRQQWGKFTDDDISKMKGNYDELHGQLQQKYGWKKEEAEDQIKRFVEKANQKEHVPSDE